MPRNSCASRSTSMMSPSCPSPFRSRSLPRRFRRRSTTPRIGCRMASNQRILLVEDDVLIGMMLADMFDALDLPEPAQATRNEEALALIAAEPLDGEIGSASCGERVWQCVLISGVAETLKRKYKENQQSD